MVFIKSFLFWPAVVLASITIDDPSDVIDPSLWAADNAIIPDYDIAMISVQPSDSESNSQLSLYLGEKLSFKLVLATHDVKGKTASASHATWSATTNDTSVLLVTEEGSFSGSYMTFDKSGYSTNLNEASFWGFNAAINVVSSMTTLRTEGL